MKSVLVEDLGFVTLLNPPHNFRTDVCRCSSSHTAYALLKGGDRLELRTGIHLVLIFALKKNENESENEEQKERA